MDINNLTIVGRLTRDPEIRTTQMDHKVASFSIAVNMFGKEKVVSYFNCVAWGKLAETVGQYCKKGMRVGIAGHISQRSWEDKDGVKRSTVEIVASNLQFLESKKESTVEPEPAPVGTPHPLFNDNEIPF